jgi:hypothetical protein
VPPPTKQTLYALPGTMLTEAKSKLRPGINPPMADWMPAWRRSATVQERWLDGSAPQQRSHRASPP